MDEAALRAWLAEPRTELIAAVAEGVRAHVATLRARGLDFYGYALVPAPYYEIRRLFAAANAEAGAFAAPNRSSEGRSQTAAALGDAPPAPLGDETNGRYRYCVEAWKHWEYEFPIDVAVLDGLHERFRSLHPKREGARGMDKFEIAHADALLDAVARGLEVARDGGAFGEATPFLVVWVCGPGFRRAIEGFARRLNPPQRAADFLKEFGG